MSDFRLLLRSCSTCPLLGGGSGQLSRTEGRQDGRGAEVPGRSRAPSRLLLPFPVVPATVGPAHHFHPGPVSGPVQAAPPQTQAPEAPPTWLPSGLSGPPLGTPVTLPVFREARLRPCQVRGRSDPQRPQGRLVGADVPRVSGRPGARLGALTPAATALPGPSIHCQPRGPEWQEPRVSPRAGRQVRAGEGG